MKKVCKKPTKQPQKKKWSCGGCNEEYKEPITEDWIGCSVCFEWWHEKCTAYIGIGSLSAIYVLKITFSFYFLILCSLCAILTILVQYPVCNSAISRDP